MPHCLQGTQGRFDRYGEVQKQGLLHLKRFIKKRKQKHPESCLINLNLGV